MNNEMNDEGLFNRIRIRLGQRPLHAIIAGSVLLRVATALAMGNAVVDLPGIFDQISYHNLALRVASGHGFSFGELWWPMTAANAPTAHWSFLYTLYLASVYVLFGPRPIIARLLQAVIVGILHPYLAYRIGETVFSKSVGLIAAALTAIYAYFVYYSAALMTESYYIIAILLSLHFAMRLASSKDKEQDIKLGLALGISIGVALLLRQVLLLFLPFLFLWIWISRFRLGAPPPLKTRQRLPLMAMALSVALIAVCVLPISIYNYSRFGRFVLLNTNSGYAFFWANNPIYGTKFVPILSAAEYRAMIPEGVRHLDEAALDQELLKRGIQFVLEDPRRYLLLSLSRIPLYFMFWYSPESGTLSNISRIGSFGILLPFMSYGLVLGVIKDVPGSGNRVLNLLCSPQGLLMIFTLVYSGIHILTWALIRYRLPVDAILLLFAGAALADIAARLSRAKFRFLTVSG